MQNRRKFVLTLVAGLVAAAVVITPVIADELFGFITSVNEDAKTLTVVPAKGDGDEVKVTVTSTTEIVTGKGDAVDLEKIAKGVSKAKDAGKKGVFAKVTHEGGKASKIVVGGAGKKKDN
jgi:hypothetical protein